MLEEMKANRQNTVDLKIELRQGLHDIKMEVAKVCTAIRDSAPPPGSANNGQQQVDQRAEAAIQNLNKDLSQVLASLPRQIANAMPVPPPPQVFYSLFVVSAKRMAGENVYFSQTSLQVIHQAPAAPAPAEQRGGLSLAEMHVSFGHFLILSSEEKKRK